MDMTSQEKKNMVSSLPNHHQLFKFPCDAVSSSLWFISNVENVGEYSGTMNFDKSLPCNYVRLKKRNCTINIILTLGLKAYARH